MNKKATLIYLDTGILPTKKPYKNWQKIQSDYFTHYKTNFEPLSKEEIIEFFNAEYQNNYPFSIEELDAFFKSDLQVIRTDI